MDFRKILAHGVRGKKTSGRDKYVCITREKNKAEDVHCYLVRNSAELHVSRGGQRRCYYRLTD